MVIKLKVKGNILGIDIGTNTISFALVKNDGKKSKILELDSIPTPRCAVNNGEIENFLAIGAEIKKYLTGFKYKYKSISMSIGSPQIIIRDFNINKVKKKEIESAVIEEVSNTYKGVTDSHDISYKVTQEDSNGIKGIVAMCPKNIVEDYMKIAYEFSGNLKYIDVSANCISKAVEVYVNTNIKTGNVIIVDIGVQKSIVNIISNGVLALSRQVPNGGIDLDKLIVKEFNISYEEAEEKKKDGYRDDLEQSEIDLFIKTAYSGIEQEISRTMNFFVQNMSKQGIHKLMLIGGGCRIPGIDKYFQNVFKVPTIILGHSDFVNVKMKKIEELSMYMSAIGAAIRED